MFRQMFHYDLPKYNEDLLVHNDFKGIVNSAKKPILEPFKEIVELYHKLPFGDKIQLQVAFSINNSVQALSDKSVNLVKFETLNLEISEKLQLFCVNLWNHYPQVTQMEADFGSVKDHYNRLMDESNFEGLICPFCGIETFEPSYGKYREAYDHLFAKAVYPFVSINFKLLFPACYKCNSNEKRTKDTIYNDDGTRRIVYYPYDNSIKSDDLEITIIQKQKYNQSNLETLLKSIKWEFDIKRKGIYDERLDSWDEVYGIKRRYSERLKRLEKSWFTELKEKFKDSQELKQSFDDFKKKFLKSAKYQILITGMGIIKYSYFNFIFSLPDIETRLNEVVS